MHFLINYNIYVGGPVLSVIDLKKTATVGPGFQNIRMNNKI